LGSKKGDTPVEDEVLVGNTQTDYRIAILLSAIYQHTWEEFEMILTGARLPEVMGKFSRIIGYYSNMRSWNKSKLAELRDRQKGNYGILEGSNGTEEPRKSKKEATPARELAGV